MCCSEAAAATIAGWFAGVPREDILDSGRERDALRDHGISGQLHSNDHTGVLLWVQCVRCRGSNPVARHRHQGYIDCAEVLDKQV